MQPSHIWGKNFKLKNWVDSSGACCVFVKRMEPVTTTQSTILIAATHRSGSYLACDWLSQLGGLPFAEEYFNFNLLAARQELRLSDDLSLSEILNRLIAHKRSAVGAFAVKAMWPAFESLFTNLAMGASSPADDPLEQAFEFLGQPKVLFVRRRDKAKQAVSFEKAKQQGVWRSDKRDEALDDTLVYSYPRILDCWNQVSDDEVGWLAFLQKHNLPYHEIWYEDMVADPMGVVGDALRFLRVEINQDVVIKSRFQKLSSGLNADWAERFMLRHNPDSLSPDRGQVPMLGEVAVEMRGLHSGPINMVPGSACIVECELWNKGAQAWLPEEQAAGEMNFGVELRSFADDDLPAGRCLWRTELESPLAPETSVVLPLRLKLSVVNRQDLSCAFVLCYPGGELQGEDRFEVKVELDAKWKFLRKVFVSLSNSDMSGWVNVPALGDIWPGSFPFIYQGEHGWLNADLEHSGEETFCASDFELGYFTLHLNEPRIFHVLKDGQTQRLEFRGVRDGQREFRNTETGETVMYALSLNSKS